MRAIFDKRLIEKYDKAGPRYTSYPPATEFTEDVNYEDYEVKLKESNERKTPLSLYFHIPFCESACWFCGCNVIISHRKDVTKPYLDFMYKEMDMLAEILDTSRKVIQLHWGGGTPNFLSNEEIKTLMEEIKKRFNIDPEGEISIEIDPRYLSDGQLETIREVGFNRISMGVQDFDEEVQKAINRIQTEELMEEVMAKLRDLGFSSINIDLVYGLPHQTCEKFERTIGKTIELSPDRVAVFNFAYVPWLKPLQRKLDPSTLPPPEEKLKILEMTVEKFQDAGYVFIGMDHFAKPEDELSIAQKKGELWRNFQGYTTKKGVELIGIGATSIGMLYDGNRLPIMRGYILNEDDIIRREVIMDLMCNLGVKFKNVKFKKIEDMFNINFKDYFEKELNELKEMEDDGLIKIGEESIDVLPLGRLLIRNVAMIFDVHTRNKKEARFSRTI